MPANKEIEVERDGNGDVTHTKTIIERPRRRGGFGWGMLFGIMLVSAGLIAFAYNQGSFQTAGRQADRASAQVEHNVDRTADNARNAVHDATANN